MTCHDLPLPDFFDQRARLARKARSCGDCRRVIRVGEKYCIITGKWEGEVSTHKRCSHCDDMARELRDLLPKFCDSIGGLWETLADGLWLEGLLLAETGDYFRVMRLVVAANRAKGETE